MSSAIAIVLSDSAFMLNLVIIVFFIVCSAVMLEVFVSHPYKRVILSVVCNMR